MSDDAMQPRDEMAGDGAPPVPDQKFFLDLARPRGRRPSDLRAAQERWNLWRADLASADERVTFEGVDFRTEENREISFSGFEFGSEASFAGATFGDRAQFGGATFGYGALFTGATFGGRACFDNVTFGDGARFDGATFGNWSRFGAAVFGNEVRFDDAVFGTRARFDGAVFGMEANFTGATFGAWANFDGALLGGWARLDEASFGVWSRFNHASIGDFTRFSNAKFDEEARFVGTTFGIGVQFDGVTFGGRVSFVGSIGDDDIETQRKGWVNLSEIDRERSETHYRRQRDFLGFGPGKFSEIDFHGAHFLGAVFFARRSFEKSANFTGVRFDQPPDFDGATNLQRIDFTGARAGFSPVDRPWWKPDWTDDSSVAIRLRALRSQIEATKNHDFERDLYIEERKAERGIHLARLWKNLRHRRLIKTALAYIGGLPRLPKIDIFAERGDPVVRWPQPPHNRRVDALPAMIGDGPAAMRLRRAYRRNGVRFLAALGPLLGHLLWITVMAVYWALSDYGRSWLRPAFWLGVVLMLFHGLGPIDGITARALGAKRVEIVAAAETARPGSGGEVGAAWDEAAKLYAVANSIPFVGPLTIDGEVKKFLFCGVPPPAPTAGAPAPAPCIPLPPAALQAATIVQNLLSILLVFFIGLALRNYFRLK